MEKFIRNKKRRELKIEKFEEEGKGTKSTDLNKKARGNRTWKLREWENARGRRVLE